MTGKDLSKSYSRQDGRECRLCELEEGEGFGVYVGHTDDVEVQEVREIYSGSGTKIVKVEISQCMSQEEKKGFF